MARLCLLVLVMAALVTALPVRPGASGTITVTVDTTSDANLAACTAAASDCSLRGALNSVLNSSVIEFAIPAGADPGCVAATGVCTITLTALLPTLDNDNVVIDGFSQTGAQPNTLSLSQGTNASLKVVVNATSVASPGAVLRLSGGQSTVQGLVIMGSATGVGSGIALETNGGNTVRGNYIGTDVTGTEDAGWTNGVAISSGSDNVVGGPANADRNVISGHSTAGIQIQGPGTLIQNNYIGTSAMGTAAIQNRSGIAIISGGNTTIKGNLVSGNERDGIVNQSQADHLLIQGNRIGTNAAASQALGNGRLGFADAGIRINANGEGTLIGGTGPGLGNVISGQAEAGIHLEGIAAGGVDVQGNLIGTNGNGTAAIPNRYGVKISGIPGNRIGANETGGRNLISGNSQSGVWITGSAAVNNVIENNFIGTRADGTSDLGNGEHGVLVSTFNAASNTRVGGPNNGEGNVIAHNDGAGVLVAVRETARGRRVLPAGQGLLEPTANVAILRNSIHSNGQLGIELQAHQDEPIAVTANDPGDKDHGANRLQNFPVLTGASSSDDTIQGTFDSTPNLPFRFEFYLNNECDPSGHGEGQTFLGAANVNTDGDGAINFTATSGQQLPTGAYITATASANDTSEFSACVQVDAPAPTASPTASPSPTASLTPSRTPAGSQTATPTPTGTGGATPSATPTATPTPAATPGTSGTPTATAEPAFVQGDVDCDGDIDSADALKQLRHVAGLPVSQQTNCPGIGSAGALFGDVDCDGDVDSADGLKVLRHVAALPVAQTEPCPDIGQAL